MSKKISLIVLAVIILLAMVIPSNKVFAASDKKVTLVNAVQENGKLTVSGEVEAGMLAVAVQVYDENDEFIKLETGAVDVNNKYEVVFVLPQATYIVKVADFDGGDVVTKLVKETADDEEEPINNNQQEEPINNEEQANSADNEEREEKSEEENAVGNPKTGDNIMVIASIFAIATIGAVITLKLNKNRKTRKH